MKGSIPRQFIDDLLTKSNIVDVINARVKLKKAGRDYQACCPFHHEKTPSFTVSEKKQFYYCFGCGAKGNAISFLMDYDKLEQAITEKTKVIIPVDIGGVMCDYDRIQKIVEKKANIFKPSSELQEKLGRIAIMADSSHAIGAMRNGKMAGEYADITDKTEEDIMLNNGVNPYNNSIYKFEKWQWVFSERE